MSDDGSKKNDLAGDAGLAGALGQITIADEQDPRKKAIISGAVDSAAAHLGAVPLPPVVKHKTMEMQRVIVPDTRKMQTMRRLDRPPSVAPPPEYFDTGPGAPPAPNPSSAVPPLAGSLPAQAAGLTGDSPKPPSARTFGGHT